MLKNKFFLTILTIIIILAIIVFYYNSLDSNYVREGGEIVEKLEKDIESYIRLKDDPTEKKNIEGRIKEYILKETEIDPAFIYRFYLARSNYFISKNNYEESLEDLNKAIKSKGLERDIASLNKGMVYEKLGKREDAIYSYDYAIKYTKLDFIKIKALFYKAILLEEKDKDQAKKIYEEIVKFSYDDNLYINISKNKLLELQ